MTDDAIEDPVLAATGVQRRYPLSRGWSWGRRDVVAALRGVDLQVAAGERVGLVGTSGSGKSTLLRCLLGLERPDRGTVSLAGRTVQPGSTASLRWYRRLVQYVPQDPAGSLDPRSTVRELVTVPLRHLHVPGDHAAAVTTALTRVGLDPELTDRRPGELSGGQAQRVALARALAPGPVLLLADEPVSGLDLPVRDQVVQVLADLSAREGLGLLLVSHDLAVVARLCDRTVVLADGLVVEEGPTTDLLTRPAHPRTRDLLAAVPTLPA
ncbi:ABC transporter ATP-binding protein [Modestobacter sp. VKM Ac-2985]|uniref:ABC transporter ATP-binding protein n=1 Tax=Modestobacter sp. VKM Ac-2985 TaxID=3004139 RepID=UPI0022ABAF31|nr:ABC transporter ATP-binding protein [Modestobacter sp. VKM Ac-2985]MCZ2839425.1 ABC transporter ATP-binding protein [Modestobacter sp. VKM Ac-2985]